MPADLSLRLAQTLERELPHLRSLNEEQSSLPRVLGKWSPKEELGHLIDSAANNHLRFMGAALAPQFHGPGYLQDHWVKLHGYASMRWEVIVDFWFAYNQLLAALISRIPESQLATKCFIAGNSPATLRFLIEDYVVHMQHHIDQLLLRDQVTPYPQRMAKTGN